MSRKKVKGSQNPGTDKTPNFDKSLVSSLEINPAWQFSTVDIEGPWGWDKIIAESFMSEIIPKMKHFESMTWREILGPTSHEVYVSQIGSSAQKRLEALKLDDVEKLVSLRFSGQQRLWGIKSDNILKLLWWDPEHEVYPSHKKHT